MFVLHSALNFVPNVGVLQRVGIGRARRAWPSDSSSAAALRTAVAHSSWIGRRRADGGRAGRCAAGRGRRRARPRTAGRAAGRSRCRRRRGRARHRAARPCRARVRLTHSSTPRLLSSRSGPSVIRPCDGFRPTRPQHDAGMRIEPPPSLAWAIGTMPGGDGGRRPAARAAGRAVGVPRVAGRAPGHRLGGRQAAELGAVGAPGDDQAGGAEAADQRGVAPARRPRVPAAPWLPLRQRLAGVRGPQVLEQERHATERAVGQSARRPRRGRGRTSG